MIDGKVLQPGLPRLAALLAKKPPMKSGALTVSGVVTSVLDMGPTLELQSIIEFGLEGSAEGVLGYGRGTPRQGHCRSTEKKGPLLVRIRGAWLNADWGLHLRIKPLVPGNCT